jgi:GNAT superfamily N-acetyltransferase
MLESPREAYRFERVVRGTETTRQHATLLAHVFDAAVRYSEQYIDWQYYENPDGEIVGYDAYDADGELAAHYVVQPLRARLFGEELRAVLSLNTATHPRHQGKGLFVELARRTYDLAASLGYACVVGVANANSTPGFVRKLGFSLLTPLDARVGIGSPALSVDFQADFERIWSPEARTWRLRRPGGTYWTRDGHLYAATGYPGIAACLSETAGWSGGAPARFAPLRVRIGLHPASVWRGVTVPIPARFRPSPLNLIYRPLRGLPALNLERVRFELVDFDAY